MATNGGTVDSRPIPPLFSLEGKTALITGAGSPTGIGFASARMLANLGAHVMITSTTGRIHERVDELHRQGYQASGTVGDLTEEATVQRIIDETVASLGSVSILVNNAGMTSVSDPGDDEADVATLLPYASWRASIERNLDTAFLVTRAAIPHMSGQKWGRIISVASVTGPVMAMRHDPAYAASKAAVVGLTRALAIDHARDGITVNAVAPGWTRPALKLPMKGSRGCQRRSAAAPLQMKWPARWRGSPHPARRTRPANAS